MLFDRVWPCLIEFEGHQTSDQKLKTFPLFSCLMGDVLFVWTAEYQICLMRECAPRLLSGLYQFFDLCLIKHVLIVRPHTSASACLVTKQCLMVFGRQTFPVCPGFYGQGKVCKRTKWTTRLTLTATRYTAVSTKVVPQKRKSVRDNADWYYG